VLAQRLSSAVVLLILFIPAAYLGGWWYLAVLVVGGVLAVNEFNLVLRHAGFHPWPPLAYILPVALVCASQWAPYNLERPILTAALIAVSAWQLAQPVAARSLADWALSIVPGLYLGWLAGALILLRNASHGWHWSLFLFAIVFTTDTAAYFGGRAFGRTPLAPTISPKKTWEGAIISWAYGTFLAAGLVRFLQLPLDTLPAMALGLALSLTTTVGDLTMSFAKRQAHVKDASHLIPGHGGLMDRLDSLLPAAAVLATYILYFTHP
jgi:phosphatidate cytidylyltransferase